MVSYGDHDSDDQWSDHDYDDSEINVEFLRISGVVIGELVARRNCNISFLKQQIFDLLGVPSAWQELVIGDTILKEAGLLGHHCRPTCNSVSITLIVSAERITTFLNRCASHLAAETLNKDDHQTLMKLLQSMGDYAKGNDLVASSLREVSRVSRGSRLLCAAIKALSHVVPSGDEFTISLIVSLLEAPGPNCDPETRCTALLAFPRVTSCEFTPATELIGALLVDPNEAVRETALTVFINQVTDANEQLAVSTVSNLLKNGHPDWHVRTKLLYVLKQVSKKGNEDAIASVLSHLGSSEPKNRVKCAALEALGCLCHVGDSKVAIAVIACFQDSHVYVRAAALTTLSQVASKGHNATMVAVAACLAHDSPEVRFTAVEALRHVADIGDDNAITSVIKYASHQSEEVRFVALKALCEVAGTGNEKAVDVAITCLQDQDVDVKCAGLECLGAVAKQGSRNARKAVVGCLKDKNVSVRLAAVASLPKVVDRGNAKAIRAIVANAVHAHAGRRRTALEALCQIASKGDKSAIAAATACLEDTDVHVRRAAKAVLASLA